MPRQQTQKVSGFCSEAAADFHANNDERAAAGTLKLGVSLVALASCGGIDCTARLGIRPWSRVTTASDGRDNGGVDRQLRPVPERQPVGDDLDPALILDRDVQVHVRHVHIADYMGAGLLADTCHSTLTWRQACATSGMPEAQAAGGKRRKRRTRNWEHGMLTSGLVGSTVSAHEAYGPACDSSSARRDAESRLAECISSARASQAAVARRCQPRRASPAAASAAHEGTLKPRSRRNSAAARAAARQAPDRMTGQGARCSVVRMPRRFSVLFVRHAPARSLLNCAVFAFGFKGPARELRELLADARWELPVPMCRLPPR